MIGVYYLCEEFTGTPRTQTDETTDLQVVSAGRVFPRISCPLSRSKCLELLRTR